MLGETNDCSVQALSSITGLCYETCHAALERQGREWRAGAKIGMVRGALEALGFRVVQEWSAATLAAATGQRVTTHSVIANPAAWRDMPDMLLITDDHIAAFKNRLLQDWSANRAMPVTAAWQVARVGARVEPPDVIYL